MSLWEIILIVMVSMLFISVVLGLFIYDKFKKLMMAQRVDFAMQDEFAGTAPIVFLGDSLTDFYPTGEFFLQYHVANRGIAGDTTTGVMARIDEVVALKPVRVFLQIGINDMIRRGKKLTPDLLSDRIMLIVQLLHDADIPVTLLSLYPVRRGKMFIISPLMLLHATNARVNAVNALLRQKAEWEGVPFVDLHALLTDERGELKKEYTMEGLHLTTPAYRIITQFLLADVARADGERME